MTDEEIKLLKLRDGRFDNLQVSLDEGQLVFLFTPDMKDTNEHFHIALGQYEAGQLRAWITDNWEALQ